MTNDEVGIELTREGRQSQRAEMTADMRAEARDKLGNVELVEEWLGDHGTRTDWPDDGDLTLTLGYRRRGESAVPNGRTVLPVMNWTGGEDEDDEDGAED